MPVQRYWVSAIQVAIMAVLLVTVLVHSPLLDGANRAFHDYVMRVEARAPHPAILIVAIDDQSIAELGAWPWPAAVHGQLLARLMDADVSVVGWGARLAPSRRDDPIQGQDVETLAQLVADSQRVVWADRGLPTPAAQLREVATAVGHARLPVDDDGLVRRVEPVSVDEHGAKPQPVPPFAQAMYAYLRGGSDDAPYMFTLDSDAKALSVQQIDYAGPPGHFPRVSYVDVLEGRVPAEALQGKAVLVGLAATGWGNRWATPLSYGYDLMPDVEVHANALDALLQGRVQTVASPTLAILLNLLPVTLMLGIVCWRRLGPVAWFGVFVAVATASMAASALLQNRWGVQISPLPAVLTLGAMGMWYWLQQWLWSVRYLDHELLQFRVDRQMAPGVARWSSFSGDLLSHRLLSLREVVQQLQDLHRFVRDSLDALPDAMLVCEVNGHVCLANATAAQLFLGGRPAPLIRNDPGAGSNGPFRGCDVLDLLSRLVLEPNQTIATWHQLFDVPARVVTVSAACRQGRLYLVKCVPSRDSQRQHMGWIISIVDVTAIQEAQRQRDQALGFVSHDMRAPQAAILSLLELRRKQPQLLSAQQLEERVERHARKALSLADGFIQLARAQSREYRFQSLDVVDLVREVIDDAWELAQERAIALRYTGDNDCAQAPVDRERLARAVGNVIGNAMKFAPQGSVVDVAVRGEPGHWVISVSDSGPGISVQAQADLFKPFFRDPSAHHVDGVGLGLPLVQAVMARHGGRVEVHSQLGKGCRFDLWVPVQAPLA